MDGMSAELSYQSGSKTGAAILGRAINLDDASLSPEAARSFLKITFPKSDQERVAMLLARNQEGGLDMEERAEVEEYLKADAILTVLKSKARLSLKRAGLKS
jgi:hypothetical protein